MQTTMIISTLLAFCFMTAVMNAQPPALFTPYGLPADALTGINSSRCAVATPDGGFILCYTVLDDDASNRHLGLVMMKLKPDGTVEWSRMNVVNDGIPGSNDTGSLDGIRVKAIARNRDGNYVIAGELIRLPHEHVNYFPYESVGIIVMIIDPLGNEITHHVYSSEFRYEADEESVFGMDGLINFDDNLVGEVVALAMTPSAIVLLTEAHYMVTLAWLTHDGAYMHSVRPYREFTESIRWHGFSETILADSSGGIFFIQMTPYHNHTLRLIAKIIQLDSTGRVIRSAAVPQIISGSFDEAVILTNGELLMAGSAINENDQSILPPNHSGSADTSFMTIIEGSDREQRVRIRYRRSHAYLRLDDDLEHGELTYLRRVGSESDDPAMVELVRLETGELMLMHFNKTGEFYSDQYVDGYSLLEEEGTYISTHSIGLLPVDQDQTEVHDSTSSISPGALSISAAVAGPTGSVLMFGDDTKNVPIIAHVTPRLPFPCVEPGTLSIDTLTRTITMDVVDVDIRPHEPKHERLDRRFAISQYDLPIDLFPLCDVPPSVDSAGALLGKNALINVDELVLSAGQSIEATLRVPFTTSIRAIRADDGEIVWERALSGMETPQRMSIPTSGWTPGVYILAIERGGSVKVLLRP